MSTTTLFVDLLVVGMQAAVWLALLALSLFGVDWVDPARVRGWEATAGVLLLPVVYPVGVFVDHLSDALLSGWRRRIRGRHVRGESRTVMDLLMTAKDDHLSAYYDYLRGRIRISRSSAFNFAVIAAVFPVFAAVRLPGRTGVPTWLLAASVSAASAAVAGLALYTWVGLTRGFHERLVRGLAVVDRLKAEAAPSLAPSAAVPGPDQVPRQAGGVGGGPGTS